MIFQLGTMIGTFNGMYTLLLSTLTLLHQWMHSGMAILVICGEFCVFDSFHCVDYFHFIFSHLCAISNDVHIHAYVQHIHVVSDGIWVVTALQPP